MSPCRIISVPFGDRSTEVALLPRGARRVWRVRTTGRRGVSGAGFGASRYSVRVHVGRGRIRGGFAPARSQPFRAWSPELNTAPLRCGTGILGAPNSAVTPTKHRHRQRHRQLSLAPGSEVIASRQALQNDAAIPMRSVGCDITIQKPTYACAAHTRACSLALAHCHKAQSPVRCCKLTPTFSLCIFCDILGSDTHM